MKKQAILAIALLVSFSAFSQKTHRVMGWKISRDIPQNEVKLNLGTTIFGLYPEISYERILSEDFSLGVTAGISLDEDEYPLSFGLMPLHVGFLGKFPKFYKSMAPDFMRPTEPVISKRKLRGAEANLLNLRGLG
jgi:hypothetical protein